MKFRDIWGKFETNLGKVGWQPWAGTSERRLEDSYSLKMECL